MIARLAALSMGVLCALAAGCGGSQPAPSSPATPATPTPQSSSAAVTGGYETVAVTEGGSITGTISVSGQIPTLPARPINKDAPTCGSGTRPSQELVVGKSGGLKNAVVIVQDVRRGKAMPTVEPQVNQTKCEYDPHVQVMPVNADISIVNNDPVLHNIHFYQGDADLFNIAQPLRGQTNKHKIEKAGFVYAECDVHGWMRGHVAVVENPYYAVTGDDGTFAIGDLPAGTYTVKIWHEYLGEQTQTVTVAAKGTSTLNLDLKEALAKKMTAKPIPASPVTDAAAPAAKAPAAAKSAAASPNAANALSGDVTVKMVSEGGSFRFEPGNITVKAGTTVTWVNDSDNRHSATDDPKFEKGPGMAILPAGGAAWSTAFIGNSEQASHTFTTPGKYQYFCRNHGQFGMVATIIVVP